MTSNISGKFNLGIYNRPFVNNDAGPYSSAPNVTNAEDKIDQEMKRLNGKCVETMEELEKKGLKPQIDRDGIFKTCGVPYDRVMKLDDGTLVEYKDGKPVTIVKQVANGDKIDKKLIKYEYPEGSIAALKTETSVINEYSHKMGHSLKVPTSIQKEAGLI